MREKYPFTCASLALASGASLNMKAVAKEGPNLLDRLDAQQRTALGKAVAGAKLSADDAVYGLVVNWKNGARTDEKRWAKAQEVFGQEAALAWHDGRTSIDSVSVALYPSFHAASVACKTLLTGAAQTATLLQASLEAAVKKAA